MGFIIRFLQGGVPPHSTARGPSLFSQGGRNNPSPKSVTTSSYPACPADIPLSATTKNKKYVGILDKTGAGTTSMPSLSTLSPTSSREPDPLRQETVRTISRAASFGTPWKMPNYFPFWGFPPKISGILCSRSAQGRIFDQFGVRCSLWLCHSLGTPPPAEEPSCLNPVALHPDLGGQVEWAALEEGFTPPLFFSKACQKVGSPFEVPFSNPIFY